MDFLEDFQSVSVIIERDTQCFDLPLVIIATIVFTEAYKGLLFLVREVCLVSELGTGGGLGRVRADGGVRVSPGARAAAGGPHRVSGRHPGRVSGHQTRPSPGTFL